MACFVGLIFVVIVYYLHTVSKPDFDLWDLENLTASDFTVEYVISEDMWHKFNSEHDRHLKDIPVQISAPDHTGKNLRVVTFEAFIEHYFLEKLNKLPAIN